MADDSPADPIIPIVSNVVFLNKKCGPADSDDGILPNNDMRALGNGVFMEYTSSIWIYGRCGIGPVFAAQ
jgi:hypothetical protein